MREKGSRDQKKELKSDCKKERDESTDVCILHDLRLESLFSVLDNNIRITRLYFDRLSSVLIHSLIHSFILRFDCDQNERLLQGTLESSTIWPWRVLEAEEIVNRM